VREPPRRRRVDDEQPGGGLPLFPLIVVVILAGLLLGGVLAHFFGGSGNARQPAPSRLAESPASSPPAIVPTERPEPTERPTPTLRPTPAPHPTPTHRPSSMPTPLPTSAPSSTPSPAVTPAEVTTTAPKSLPASARLATASPATPAAVASADEGAAWVVRSYVQAVARGDQATAATFLMHGRPTETFISADSRIKSIRSTPLGGSGYTVKIDVRNASGEFYGTFTLEPGASGLQISDHSWTAP
jgi:outer membrane biosynthesis protein TonB